MTLNNKTKGEYYNWIQYFKMCFKYSQMWEFRCEIAALWRQKQGDSKIRDNLGQIKVYQLSKGI